MKKVKFKDLNNIAKILKDYSTEEREEIVKSFDIDFEKYYNALQSKGWNITTNKGTKIYNLHRTNEEN